MSGATGAASEDARGARPSGPAATDATEVPTGAGAMLYVLVALVAVGLVLGPIGTLIIWWLRRDEPFLDHHGRQALDITLSGLLLGGGLFVAARGLDAVALEWAAFAMAAYAFVLSLIGGVVAFRGGMRRLPVPLPLLRRAPDRI